MNDEEKAKLINKMSPEDLKGYLHLRRRGGKIAPKKEKAPRIKEIRKKVLKNEMPRL